MAGSSARRLDNTQNGFALLIVLLIIAILALMDSAITVGARTKMNLAEDRRAAANAEAAANAGIAEAIFHLQGNQWAANATYTIRIGAAQVNIVLRDEATKINPNRVTWNVLRLLLIKSGMDEATATRIAKSIVDYRDRTETSLLGGQSIAQYLRAGLPYGPSHRPFESLDEIGLVIGMTPDLLARIEPYLSIYQEGSARENNGDMVNNSSLNDIATASRPTVSPFADSGEVVKIVAEASLPGRVRFVREAIVRFRVQRIRSEAPFQVLTWETPND